MSTHFAQYVLPLQEKCITLYKWWEYSCTFIAVWFYVRIIGSCVPADEARRPPVLAHLPQGQTLDSHWVGESERYLQRSGKPWPRREDRREGVESEITEKLIWYTAFLLVMWLSRDHFRTDWKQIHRLRVPGFSNSAGTKTFFHFDSFLTSTTRWLTAYLREAGGSTALLYQMTLSSLENELLHQELTRGLRQLLSAIYDAVLEKVTMK